MKNLTLGLIVSFCIASAAMAQGVLSQISEI